MNFLKAIIRSNRLYFLMLLLAGMAGLCLNDLLFISLHAHHPVWLNIFFINYSFMGDGIFAIALAAVYFFYFKDRRTGMTLLFSFVFAEALIQLIKNLLSNGDAGLFFEKGQYLFFTDEAAMVNFHSFPSGHTAVAFAMVTVLVLNAKNKRWMILLFPGALLLAVSRMYLAQHSVVDLVAGAFIGAGSSLFVFAVAGKIHTIKQWFRKIHWLENDRATAANIHSL